MLAMLYDRGKIDGALIICPKGVMGTWRDQEIPAHLPNHIENVSFHGKPISLNLNLD